MKSFVFACVLVVAVSASLLEEHGAKFQSFKLAHGKTYMNQAEETKRFAIFRNNLRSIEQHNALYEQGLKSWKQRVTKFADMTQEEFLDMLATHAKPSINGTKYVESRVALPDSVDWRTEGQVTGVKDQGSCGSCWAFSITGSTEAAYYRKSGNLVSLSEQQLVDCATMNAGCDGGYLEQTFPYIQQNGLESESDYPYTGRDGTCQYKSSKVVTKVSSYKVLASGNENQLLNAVGTVGPVSIAMDASYLSFYDSGIYDDEYCSSSYLNHGVLVVGYGSENGVDYWIVKNSWGTSWGESGFFKLLRGKDMCGVSQDTVYPIIN
ncbi:procathepsin L-like [Anthonomus grandis grandis]|uniref:procathepsin L-like n=1 Tax=Anthonomus grandis grandis TaxID=2921223 RepID=UPI00216528C1|nr:procathepsin L-like [Anthonomus grandis grandis]